MAIVVKQEEITDSEPVYDLEYRASEDDAWYSVAVVFDAGAETLSVKYMCAPVAHEAVFSAGNYRTEAQVDEFVSRFRPVSQQLQDSECLKVSIGTTVCASYRTVDNDLRFYDADVEAVERRTHSFSGGEVCLCTFVLFWKHGRGRGSLSPVTIENLRLLKPASQIDPRISNFAEVAKRKIASFGTSSNRPSLNRIRESKSSKRNKSLTVKTEDLEQICNYDQWTNQDEDMGSISCIPDVSAQTDDHHFILINNLEKDLTPSEIKKFIHEKTTILPEACVFPSLSTDPFARGAIMVDSQKKAQTIQDYLENSNHFVVSSRGRPWVITTKASAKLFAMESAGQQSDVLDANEQKDAYDKETCGPTGDSNIGYENKPGEILKNLQIGTYIYTQDVVKSKTKTQIGTVTKVPGDSDSDSSITDDEEEDEDEDEVDNGKDDEAGSNEEDGLENDKNSGENAVDSNESNDSKNEALTADEVRVLWLDGSETTECIKDVEVIDRGFLHGDYVAAATDPTGQIGIVVDVSINVDLLTHDGSVVRNKPSRELMRIRDFTVGDHVVLGPWLGRIEDVFDNVTVQLDDGSVCRVMKAEPQHLKPVGMTILVDGDCPYYPGQRVQARSSSIFKNSQRLSGLWKANRLEGTVTKVTVGSVFIYWIASAGCGPDSATTPAKEQSPKNLKLLSCFVHTNWKLGDWCLLPPSKESSVAALNRGSMKADSHDSAKDEPESTAETGDVTDSEVATMEHSSENNKSKENDLDGSLDQTCETSENKAYEDLGNSLVPASKDIPHETWPLHRKNLRKVVVRKDKKARKKVENFERALLIINTSTEVDVVWQDGKINRDLDPRALIPIDCPGDHELVAEQYVVEKAADSDDTVEPRRVGVIKSFDAKDRTACVRWLKPVARAEDPREFDKEEMMSVYELEGHPDYDYHYGNLVVRLSPITLPDKMDSFVHSVDNMPLSDPDELKQENGWENTENTTDHEKSTEFSDLSWVGNITGLSDGDIEVTWADGMISTVGPRAIYVVGLDDDESMAAGSDGDDDAASWETADDDADSVNPEEHGMENAVDSGLEIEDDPNGSEHSGKSGALSLPLAAIGFMPKLASGIFSRGRRNSDPLDIDIRNEDDLQLEGLTLSRDRDSGSSSQKAYDIEEHLAKPITKCKEEEHDAAEANLLEIAETLCNIKAPESNDLASEEFVSTFRGFDIVRDPLDHHFLGAQKQSNAARKWLKKVHQDCDILQNNLPEGIYVRIYEDRMDLMRAAIVGAYGTPYQDGLFFFDFHLPPEYPDVPPSAHYLSGGWKINPNLDEEGKVCLSLLNTWLGTGNEAWEPSTSSILQVLVSLQGLVLNSKPYFNEAGYDRQVGTAEGEKNSLSYNENTFLLNCKTMMHLMRRTPKDFEQLVFEHFRKRGRYILKACDAYMKGHLIGSLAKDASGNDSFTNSNSVGFKLMLAKVLPKLLSALNEVGAECREFEHLTQL